MEIYPKGFATITAVKVFPQLFLQRIGLEWLIQIPATIC